jgi:toxin ParE1/3/4
VARFDLAELAQSDLVGIAEYTAERWGQDHALKYLDALEVRLKDLANRPSMGRQRDELVEGLRSFPFESHVIYYRRADFGIIILRILHKRQDPHRHTR